MKTACDSRANASSQPGRGLVWDSAVRLNHWLWVLGIGLAWWSSTSDRWLVWHVAVGYIIFLLWIWRLAWGIYGSQSARFSDFPCSLTAAWGYLRALWEQRAPRYLGHNPAGALAIYGLITLLGGVLITGVLVLGAEEQRGPFAAWASIATGVQLHQLHLYGAWALLGVIVLHIAGVVVESYVHQENLVAAMVSGYKARVPQPPLRHASYVAGALLLVMVLGAAGYMVSQDSSAWLAAGPTPVTHPLWEQECGACHLAYSSSLLPERAWVNVLANSHAHFGTDLALDQSTLQSLQQFVQTYNADTANSEAGWRIAHSLAPQAVPERISSTAYWQAKHQGLQPWLANTAGAGDCAACHSDAASGRFEDGAMRLP